MSLLELGIFDFSKPWIRPVQTPAPAPISHKRPRDPSPSSITRPAKLFRLTTDEPIIALRKTGHDLPHTVLLRLCQVLRKSDQTRTLATLMRCSSATYEVAGLALYQHLEVAGDDIGRVLYGEEREFASSSDLERIKPITNKFVFGLSTPFAFQPSFPIISAQRSPLYPKNKTPQQRKIALLSLTKTLQITTLPTHAGNQLFKALTYPHRTLFPRLENLALGKSTVEVTRSRMSFANLLQAAPVAASPAFLMAIQILRPKHICIRLVTPKAVDTIVAELARLQTLEDPDFHKQRLETCTIHSPTPWTRSRETKLVIPGVNMAYHTTGVMNKTSAVEDRARSIVGMLKLEKKDIARGFDFVDVGQLGRSTVEEMEAKEREIIGEVKEVIRGLKDREGFLTYDELDERVRFWSSAGWGKCECCGQGVVNGMARSRMSGERRYLRMSDVSVVSEDDQDA